MKNCILGVSLCFSVACSHQAADQKLTSFPYAPELLIAIQSETNRLPAQEEAIELEGKSPRRVYFSTLYHQYLTIGQHLDRNSTINFCPQFHHDRIEMSSYGIPQVLLYSASHVAPDGQKFFPELAFNKNFSIKDYHDSLREELKILCDEGVSDNFYKFDNLITHYANRSTFHLNKSAMESVLKIPVFANFYLIKMLQGPEYKMVSTYPDEKKFIKLTKTLWFDRYVTEAGRLRESFIKTKMVKR